MSFEEKKNRRDQSTFANFSGYVRQLFRILLRKFVHQLIVAIDCTKKITYLYVSMLCTILQIVYSFSRITEI